MAANPIPAGAGQERIPFYRNVKVIGLLAQIVFVLVVLAAAVFLVRNVVIALQTSNLPADFSFLNNRSGIPIGETPIRYSPENPYTRAFAVGILNTLKVALVGVVATSLLGVLIGVMRLSNNWLLRQLATGYVETIRNTPVAVQIIFWFSAVLLPLPPRIGNPLELPGGILFSNKGIAFPLLYPSYRFGSWLPWLIAALVVLVIGILVRRRQIRLSERPGNAWLFPLGLAVVVAAGGYVVAAISTSVPKDVAADFVSTAGRGTIFTDIDGDGSLGPGEPVIPFAAMTVTIDEAELRVLTQNLTESRGVVDSTFRFPLIKRSEAEQLVVAFKNPDDAQRFALHFLSDPNVGLIYQDSNVNGSYDRGEELSPNGRGFSEVALTMTVRGFRRQVVADRNGAFRVPNFKVVGSSDDQGEAGLARPFGVLGGDPLAGAEAGVEASIEVRSQAPLTWSRPTVPVSDYFGGIRLSSSFLALLLALVVYTASFIAEIVRAGILAVPKGQREAAQAVGLSGFQTFSLVVFPQALRIILPPLISQYLNLTKNSSLGTLAAFAELFAISAIIANQTGASIPMALLLIASYLVISLVFAFVLNLVNERLKLVER